MKTAFVTGVTGQDGSYLSELLLEKGYIVYGMVRRTSGFNRERIEHLHGNYNFKLIYGDLGDSNSIMNALKEAMPDEVYNLGAQSHVRISFDMPEYTADVNALGTLRVLEAIKKLQQETGKKIKFYQASTSEMFGKVMETPQKETTPFYPRSPYGCAKLYAYWITRNYREGYGMFACNGILFNHESPRRGENFVTRKITIDVAKIKLGMLKHISLGNIDARRDWGHARDYVEAMWLMMQKDKPDDYVIATGEAHTVREFLVAAFNAIGVEIESNGKSGLEEEYIRKDTGEVVVKIDPKFFRPAEVEFLLGDPTKAKRELGWKPKIKFEQLVKEMVEADMKKIEREKYGTEGKR